MPQGRGRRFVASRHGMVLFLLVVGASLAVLVDTTSARTPLQVFGGRGGGGGAPQSAQDAAPVDLTGYWVSVVTEDWIERMSPDSPPSGTGGGVGAGRGGAEVTPDPNEPCRVYGAGGSMRVPGRIFVSWADEDTLQIDMDAGTQTRLFHFNPTEAAPAANSLQGHSVATWSTGAGGGGRGGRGRGGGGPPAWGTLRVVTTNLTAGYLLSSRSLYSENAVLTEEFIFHSDFGEEYVTVRASVQDGGANNTTSSTFRREPDGSMFNPSGCEVIR